LSLELSCILSGKEISDTGWLLDGLRRDSFAFGIDTCQKKA